MVPIQAGRLVSGKMDIVVEGLPRVDQGLDHLVGMTTWQGVGAVKVDADRGPGQDAGPAIGLVDFQDQRRRGRVVGQVDNKMVAGINVQSRILKPFGGHEAEQVAAVRVGGGLVGKIDFQHAVGAEQIGRVGDDASRSRTLAGVRHRRDRPWRGRAGCGGGPAIATAGERQGHCTNCQGQ
jgi:hypothetical protein